MDGGKFKRKLSEVNTRAVTERIGRQVRLSFRMFACAIPMVISSIFGKSFPFPYFVLFVLQYMDY
jgi:hypothetical protein